MRVFVQAGTDPLFTLNDHSIVDADSLYRPTGRLIDAAEQLCARLDEARG
ncbi:periplasmic binding protein [Bordetella pertussis]|nr:periplasmic binding protein [Bordetella pertussis]